MAHQESQAPDYARALRLSVPSVDYPSITLRPCVCHQTIARIAPYIPSCSDATSTSHPLSKVRNTLSVLQLASYHKDLSLQAYIQDSEM